MFPNIRQSWTFWNQADPTHGLVNYVNKQQAQQAALVQDINGQFQMGVDDTTSLAVGQPRDS
jgi:hypothetical protein